MAFPAASEEYESAQARAAAYGLIAYGFRYPDDEAVSSLRDPARWEGWPSALLSSGVAIGEAVRSVRKAVSALAGSSDDPCGALQRRFDELFGHAVRGRCPAYEMEYGRHEIIRQASDLADLAGFYAAFGLEIAGGTDGRPDHISAECEFMSALCLKEAHAHEHGDKANAEICVDAQRTFLRDHLACWLPALAHSVEEADADGFLGALAAFADAFVKAECGRFDIKAGPPMLELKPPDPVLDTQISCGSDGCGSGGASEQVVQLGTGMVGSEKR